MKNIAQCIKNYYDFWKYVFSKPEEGVSRCTAIICRMRSHPYGVIWYNPSGDEPNMRCTNCYEDLG